MRDQSRMSVAVAAILLALSSSPLRVWADSQRAQSTAPTSEIPKESPGAGNPEPPSATILDPLTVQSVLGREVRSVADENMGRIVDIIVDRSGQVRAAVIDFGGFLGVGSRKIAVDWSILSFGSGEKSDRVVVDLTRVSGEGCSRVQRRQTSRCLGRLGRDAAGRAWPCITAIAARPEPNRSPEQSRRRREERGPGVDHASKFECRRPHRQDLRAPAFAGSIGSLSSWRTFRPVLARSSRSI